MAAIVFFFFLPFLCCGSTNGKKEKNGREKLQLLIEETRSVEVQKKKKQTLPQNPLFGVLRGYLFLKCAGIGERKPHKSRTVLHFPVFLTAPFLILLFLFIFCDVCVMDSAYSRLFYSPLSRGGRSKEGVDFAALSR